MTYDFLELIIQSIEFFKSTLEVERKTLTLQKLNIQCILKESSSLHPCCRWQDIQLRLEYNHPKMKVAPGEWCRFIERS